MKGTDHRWHVTFAADGSVFGIFFNQAVSGIQLWSEETGEITELGEAQPHQFITLSTAARAICRGSMKISVSVFSKECPCMTVAFISSV